MTTGFFEHTEDPVYGTLTVKEKQPFSKRVLIIDDGPDITLTSKEWRENSKGNEDINKRIEVYLLLTDINLLNMNGFQLCEKILLIDINVRVCFMSSGEINLEALREIYPTLSLGCFLKKPVTMDYLIERIKAELD
jgi:DNA-binding response OmpR family regulator